VRSKSKKTKSNSKKSPKKNITKKSSKKKAIATNKSKAKTKKQTKSKSNAKTKIKSKQVSSKEQSKTQAIKKTADKRLKVEQVTVEQSTTPAYLITPSKTILQSFRNAAKKRQKLIKQSIKAKTPGANFLAPSPKNGKRYNIDLRVHSPGTSGYFATSGVDAGAALVRLANVKGIDMVGLTDYYNASYIDAVQESAKQYNVTVIPGFDIRCKVGSCSDVPLTVLFPETYNSEMLFAVLTMLDVPKSAYGKSEYVMTKSFAEVLDIVETNGGVIIPSRLDKTPIRQSVLPILIEEYGFHAFDLVHPENTTFFVERWPRGGFTFFSFSNANALAQVGSRTAQVKLPASGFAGIKALVERRDQA
jgi:hypothetical protein